MSLHINDLLVQAVEENASDLHLTVGAVPILRIHGVLCTLAADTLEPSDTEMMVKALLTPEQQSKLEATGDLDCSYTLPGISRYRINVYRSKGCYGAAIRVIPTRVPDFTELGLPDVMLDFVNQPQGLVLVTGPTGHGKSTTLASLVDFVNRTSRRHIVTLEDPIEYLHQHEKSIINQREVGIDTPSFADGLRAALRQDPDVILVGEMRDIETIQTAVTAAETGHLVLATLHTNSATQTVERIIDVFPTYQQSQIRFQLASVLLGIVSQRLIPVTSGDGRILAAEILVNTPAVANLIRTEKVHQLQTVLQTGKAQGMQTMESHIQELIARGLVDERTMSSLVRHSWLPFGLGTHGRALQP